MHGETDRQAALFSYDSLEARVPADHSLGGIWGGDAEDRASRDGPNQPLLRNKAASVWLSHRFEGLKRIFRFIRWKLVSKR